MRVPLSWLREYVDVDLPAEELAHRLTMAGVEVGEVIRVGGWEHCFVGQVLSVGAHPQADRLSLCRVSTGAEEMEVVCGAPNVAAGQKVCFAMVGANLYDSHSGKREPLKAARIRGVVSQGMICSELELGLGEGHDGIVVLPDEAPVGRPLDQYLGDTILDLELTPNRSDCLSILGVAHEVAALTGKRVREPDLSYPEEGPPVDGQVSISIADADLCHRYTATLIEAVQIGPSPHWLQERLTSAGLRPINNVVDATNYVMLEFNQPLHAFDFRRVQQATVVVRRARAGETLVSLDGVQRKLGPDVLVIGDAHDAIGLGGVIGGANSEIGPNTTAILLESATFNAYNNRQTAQELNLHTDATLRFEKGLRPELAPIALRRATRLIHQVAGGRVAQGIIDVFPDGSHPHVVPLTQARLNKILGMDIDWETVEGVLASLGFQCRRSGTGSLDVEIPYWRNDISIEEDLVEEVVRTIGYDSVPTTMLSTPIPYRSPAPEADLRELVKDTLAGAGVQEVINYPLVSLEYLERVNGMDSSNPPLRIANPLSSSQEYLRPTLRASLLATLAANQGHSEGPFQLFEVGRTFHPRPEELPHERQMLSLLVSGRRWEPSWLEDDSLVDFFDAKGLVEAVLDRVGVAADFEPAEDPFFQSGRCAEIKLGGTGLGIIGEVHPTVRDRFGLNAHAVALVELDLEVLNEGAQGMQRRFKTLSRYPAATRDLALVLPAGVPEGRVHHIIARHRLVERVELFDIYSGENIPADTRSLAFHVYFQSQERTLTTEEVNRSLQGLLRTLEREVGAIIRA
ncbi:MAG: phenylalanine--tRNA ligase subunit beta [SAR202 cluster bacterium Io17-Chloro-G9]|nr:MAG: phenylalanine--tRNA ligase subunit beta [SAR202 cluster bacterium Io17-Chloro-G9]